MRPTIMKISTDAIAHNARLFRKALPERVRMMCVIKANAYGHDSVHTARKLLDAGADAFAVAIVEEARTLREAGIDLPILVLGGAGERSLREGVAIGASQAVYEGWMLDVLRDEAIRSGVRAKAHLKLDTGMSRIGVRDAAALDALLEKWQSCPEVEMEGVFTHFCAADTDPAFTQVQKQRFIEGLERVHAAGFDPIAHAAATSAMLDRDLQFDMVRPGIGLYGTCVEPMAGQLQYAQTLVTRPIRIQRIAEGDTVGYGRTFTAERDSVIMTLPIGYGDGYPRILSNRASVLVRGRRARQVGRVCMDMMMADITDIPGVTLEDEVVLMGAQGGEVITPDELAAHAETIPYEIMLGFGARIPVVQTD
ncbi:MAG: alanine racemase [Clostridia bacterium]|nr:alanine racemase [Clostridia bacterium]